MKLLSLDPSSTVTGYAVLDGVILLDAGRILPVRQKDPPNSRIDAMISELLTLVREQQPEAIVIEDTSGKVSGRHGGRGAGLAIYGKAVGEVRRAMKQTGIDVFMVLENDWTRGMGKKIDRQRWCEAAYSKQYRAADDPGGDVADAIKLGRWWLEARKLKRIGLLQET